MGLPGEKAAPKLHRAGAFVLWLLPVFLLLWLYRGAFGTWFFADDFAWLSLLHRVQVRHDLLQELFAPAAQGTIRPWSERGYFILLHAIFGLDPIPFRIAAFATAGADAILLCWVTRRLTGSRAAGLVAPVLWIANTALVTAMTWSSGYNELMCALFLLTALALFIRYTETGKRKFWWWQLGVFVLGFGVLEINIVYPALAAAWVLFTGAERRWLRQIVPQAAFSVAYFALHRMAAPLPAAGPYALHFDFSIFKTLEFYSMWALVPSAMERFGYRHRRVQEILLIGLIAVVAFVIAEIRQRRSGMLFCLGWFLITLAPLLPLRDHRLDYYLTIPMIGIAMLGGMAAGRYWTGSAGQRVLVAIPIAAYLWTMIPMTQTVTNYWRGKSLQVRALVLGVSAARQAHPNKAIALDGISEELYHLSLADSPFVVTQVQDVYLTPGSDQQIPMDEGGVEAAALVLDPAVMAHAITHDDVVVYSIESDHLRNITEGYARQFLSRTVDRLPTRVDVGNSLYSWLLGPTWLPPESGIRWMPGSAKLRIGVPEGGGRLELEGRCPSLHLSEAPRHLMVLADGVLLGDTRIYDPERTFRRLIPIPADLLGGKKSVEIEIRVDPVDRIDGQDYGLVFGQIGIGR